jgi:hypothetical protein
MPLLPAPSVGCTVVSCHTRWQCAAHLLLSCGTNKVVEAPANGSDISTGLQAAPVIEIPVDGPWLMWTVPIGVGLSYLMWHSCVRMGGPTEGAAALLAVPAINLIRFRSKLCFEAFVPILLWLIIDHDGTFHAFII